MQPQGMTAKCMKKNVVKVMQLMKFTELYEAEEKQLAAWRLKENMHV